MSPTRRSPAVALPLVLLACAADPPGDAPADTDAPGADTAPAVPPACADYDAPCDAAPVRADARRCGATLTPVAPPARPWPERLSDLGCFVDGDPDRPTADLVPYDVASALWTQGVAKRRYLSVPPGTTLGVTAEGAWDFPEDGMIVKVFEDLVADPGGDAHRPLEVRVMWRAPEGWRFATYRWDPDLGDGVLMDEAGEVVTERLVRDGQPVEAGYWYPGLTGCTACHSRAAEEPLGPRTEQLDVVVDHGEGPFHQLVAWWAAGLLDRRPDAPGDPRPLPDPLGTAPLEARARSWLHANCAHCHQPGGYGSTDVHMDLRFHTPLAEMNVCGVRPERPWVGEGDALITPGAPHRSHIVLRVEATDYRKMPPDGATLPDRAGIEVLRAWITSLEGCP